jgi:tRNA threonylcarbamoyladenosine biosynthesis protein TsaB
MLKTLALDTSDNKKISVGIDINGIENKIVRDSVILRSEATLSVAEELLKKNNLKINDINQVKVNVGPGSFTGVRVGVAIANALSFLLKIPVNGKKVGELEEPVYNE